MRSWLYCLVLLVLAYSPARAEQINSEGWTFCATENQECDFFSAGSVRYGADTRFSTLTFDKPGYIVCSNNTFGGDPAGLTAKACYFKAASSSSSPPASSPTSSPSTGASGAVIGDPGRAALGGGAQYSRGENTSSPVLWVFAAGMCLLVWQVVRG